MRAISFIAILLLLSVSSAAEGPDTIAISELDALKLENIILRLQVLDAQAKPLVIERDKLVKDIAKRAKVDWDKYDLDLSKRLLTRRNGK